MTRKINLNSDMGESFGRYTLGNDEALMPLLTAANVACGYHAADPATMRSSVQLAKKHGVGVGAHISYPDLVGFGRRDMILSREEVADITVHQIGALWGFCQSEGVPLEHVKGHGYLGVKSWADEGHAGRHHRRHAERRPEPHSPDHKPVCRWSVSARRNPLCCGRVC